MGHNGYVKLIKILKNNGCTVIRQGKGSHEWWYSPISENTFTVSKNIYKRDMMNVILKQAGLKKEF